MIRFREGKMSRKCQLGALKDTDHSVPMVTSSSASGVLGAWTPYRLRKVVTVGKAFICGWNRSFSKRAVRR